MGKATLFQWTIKLSCLLILSAGHLNVAFAVTESEFQELRMLVQDLKRQLEAAERKLEEVSQDVSDNAQAVEVTAEAVETAAAKPSVFDKLSIGGYGELHYNNYDADDSENDKDEIDLHRFVLFLGYRFTDKLRFISEIEVEHALVGYDEGEPEPGELEIEQAYIEYDFNSRNSARAGLFLIPVGMLNETHEPPTFYGVERNTVENVIIPATWWAGGIGYTHRSEGGFSFDLALHEGLKIDVDGKNARIRSGRQKTAQAAADDLALTGRIKYTGVPGLELAVTAQHQEDLTQESGDEIDDAFLWEAHLAYNKGMFGLRALYAAWDVDAGGAVKANGFDEQEGWYVEPSFRPHEKLGLFLRYEDVEGGRSQDEFDQWTAGVNFWLHEDVVLKADYQERDHDNTDDEGRDYEGFNLGVGYQF